MTRKTYKLTEEQRESMIDKMTAARNQPLIMLQCGMPPSAQQVANDLWIALGKEMGFDGMTVQASSKGNLYFTAIETEQK